MRGIYGKENPADTMRVHLLNVALLLQAECVPVDHDPVYDGHGNNHNDI